MRVLTRAKDQDQLAPLHGAQVAGKGGELDHQQPPDGQGEGQPGGHSVDQEAEVIVEECKDAPGQRELLLWVPPGSALQVHVEGEEDILNHHQAVSHSNPSQDEVDGVGPHVLVCEDQDVEDVGECAQHTHHGGQGAMVGKVGSPNPLHAAPQGGREEGGIARQAGRELLHVLVFIC